MKNLKTSIINNTYAIILILISIIFFTLLPFFKIHAQVCNPDNLQPVRFGQKGEAVKNLQFCLIQLGYNLPGGATGYYGIQTKKAVKEFYSQWYQGKWTGIRIDKRGINEMKKRLSLKSEKKQETKGIIDKVRSYDLKFDFDYIGGLNLNLSKDGKYGYFVFINRKDIQYYIQINNQTYGPYKYASDPQFSNDGSKYGWWFIKDNQHYIQINNQTYGPYDTVFDLLFSNDSSKYGWVFGKDCRDYPKCNQYYIQINNQTYGPYEYANFIFTQENRAYIIYVKDNKMIIERID
jgi:peptidoglycan hydrolase-like protein with peptidoglycan-binding domain